MPRVLILSVEAGEKVKRRIEDLKRWRDVALAFTGLDKDEDLMRSHDATDNGGVLYPSVPVPPSSKPQQMSTCVNIDSLLSVEWPNEHPILMSDTNSRTPSCFDPQHDSDKQNTLTYEEFELQSSGDPQTPELDEVS